MKWYIFITVLFFCFVFFVSSINFAFATNGAKTFKIGIYDNKPKVYLDDNGIPAGLFPDVLNYIAEQENWYLDYIFGTWEEGLARLKNGEIDVMVDVALSDERRQIFDFTNETVFNSWGVIFANKNSNINSFAQLAGKRISILKSSIYYSGPESIIQYIHSFGFEAKFIGVDRQDDAFDLLNRGEVDAAVVSRIFSLANQKDYPNIKETEIFFSPTELRFALAKGSPNSQYLIGKLDYWVKKMRENGDGIYRQILEYNGLSGIIYEPEVVPRWISIAELAGIAALLLSWLIIIWLRRAGVITTRKLRESQELDKALIEAANRAGIGIAILQNTKDKEAAIMMVNDQACIISGYSKAELIKLTISDVMPKTVIKEILVRYRERQQGKAIPSSYETIIIRKDKTTIPVAVGLSTLNYQGKIATVVYLKDIAGIKRADEEFKKLFIHQQALLAAIPDIIMEVNNDKVYTWANQFGLDFFGSDVIGKEAAFYFEGEQKTYKIIEPLFRGKERTFYLESWQRRKDGAKRLLAWWCQVLKDEKGNVIGALSSAHDITESRKVQEALQKSQRQLNDVIEFLPDAVFAIDKEKKVIIWNKAIEEMTGVKAKDMIGKGNFEYTIPFYGIRRPSLTDLLWEKDEMAIKKYTEVKREGDALSAEAFCNALYDGKGAYVFAKVSALRDQKGEVIGAIELIRDITKEKELDAAKSDFLYMASHQLRTPLSSIKWTLELFMQDKDLREKQKERLNDLYISNERLIALANSLLMVNRIEVGKLTVNKKVIDITKFIDNLTKILKPSADKKKQKVNIVVKTKMKEGNVDPLLFEEIFNNLLNNAIKFAPEDSAIDIIITTKDEEYVISIHNIGSPIPKADHDKIFTKFYQRATRQESKSASSGLGLFIAKSVVDACGGKIWFESGAKKRNNFLFHHSN